MPPAPELPPIQSDEARLLPVLASAKQAAQATHCTSNIKQIGLGFHYYSSDHRGWITACVWDSSGFPEEKLFWAGNICSYLEIKHTGAPSCFMGTVFDCLTCVAPGKTAWYGKGIAGHCGDYGMNGYTEQGFWGSWASGQWTGSAAMPHRLHHLRQSELYLVADAQDYGITSSGVKPYPGAGVLAEGAPASRHGDSTSMLFGDLHAKAIRYAQLSANASDIEWRGK